MSNSVSFIASNMHPVSFVFSIGAEPNLTRHHLVEEDWLRSIESSSQPLLRNATIQKISVIGTTTLHVRMQDPKFRVVFGVVRFSVVQVLLHTSFIDRFLNDILICERKIIWYKSRLVLIVAINDLPGADKNEKDSAPDVRMRKQNRAPRLVHVSGKTKISPRSEVIVIVVTEAKT